MGRSSSWMVSTTSGRNATSSKSGRLMTVLDPRLLKVLSLWSRAATEGERQAARARGEALATKTGLTFEDAVTAWQAEQANGNPSVNIFAGFDDVMEAREPGHKVRQATAKAGKVAARVARKGALIARYGCLEFALAPCERELRLLDAVVEWRVCCDPPHQRWTHDLDGWLSPWETAPGTWMLQYGLPIPSPRRSPRLRRNWIIGSNAIRTSATFSMAMSRIESSRTLSASSPSRLRRHLSNLSIQQNPSNPSTLHPSIMMDG